MVNNLSFLNSHPIQYLSLTGFSSILNLHFNYNTIDFLELINCNLGLEESVKLGQQLSNCHHLKSIKLEKSNNAGNIFQKSLPGKRLMKIRICNCDLTEEQNHFLGRFLKDCHSLQEIDVSYNGKSGNELKPICNGLESSSNSILKINLAGCSLNELTSGLLGDFLQQCNSLRTIDLSFNYLCGQGFQKICQGLKSSSKSLSEMNIYECSLTVQQSCWLGNLLRECTSLQIIDFSCNDTCGKSLQSICEGLKSSSTTLTKIDFSGCFLSDEQSYWLGDFLEECNSLKEIDLSFNSNCRIGFKKICHGLKSSANTLLKITLDGCCLTDEQSYWLASFLQYCNSLQEIDLSFNSNYGNAIKNICNGLKTSINSLSKLTLDGCDLTDEQTDCLDQFLKDCISLKEFYFT
ncbi:unnamed protein product [Dimorphilus gyrociliatus]|uniref:Uncharacterized protein n=1 Tax=Dimorphilus gyrociliatus TaxID=2664684 RepID=A0A7I8V8H8_9ANNE|nr:unnamed protein product [Dimorphilus gyrociliatus]